MLTSFLSDIKSDDMEVIEDRVEAFKKAQFTEKWQKG